MLQAPAPAWPDPPRGCRTARLAHSSLLSRQSSGLILLIKRKAGEREEKDHQVSPQEAGCLPHLPIPFRRLSDLRRRHHLLAPALLCMPRRSQD